jgi:precorrin-6A synthase
MRKLLVIGVGCGNPDHLTVEAIRALNDADVFFIPDKGEEKAGLRALRLAILERFVERSYRTVDLPMPKRTDAGSGYRATVDDWHAAIAARYIALLEAELTQEETGALLVWGDPALYDSTIRILERIRAGGFAFDFIVIPGISSVQVLAARHRIALNTIGGPVVVTTGRRLAAGLPADADSVVVMLDGEQTFARLADTDLEIWWGAYLGSANEILVSGRLEAVKDEILAKRADARARHGWIMDVYLLRRRGDAETRAEHDSD